MFCPNVFYPHICNLRISRFPFFEQTLLLNNNLLECFPAFESESTPNNIGKTLRTLDLSWNLMEILGEEIGYFKKLFIFNASHNKLNEVNDEIKCLSSLKNLDFSYNELIQLPSSLSCLRELNILNVSHNNFSSIPISFSSLKQDKLEGNCINSL